MIQKTLLLGLLVLAALILGTPALVGLYLSKNFDHYVDTIEQPGLMRVIGTRFHRGWFQSRAQITVQLANRLCADPPCATLTLNSTIYQGPWALAAPTPESGEFSPVWAVVDSRLLPATLWPSLDFRPSLKPLHIITRVGLGGQIDSRAWLPSARFAVAREGKAVHVDMARLLLTLRTSLGQAALRFSLAWPLLRINGAKRGHFELEGLRAGLVTAPGDRSRIVKQHLRLNSLTLDNGKGLTARLHNVVWKAGPVPGDADGMATQFNTRIKRLVINSRNFGPLKARGRIKGVDLSIWRKLRAQFIETSDARGPDTTALRTLYNLYLPPVLEAGPVFDVRQFSLATRQGEVSGQVLISVSEDIHAPDSLSALLDQIRLVLRVRLPEPLLRLAIQRIATARDLLEREVTSADIDKAVALLKKEGLIKSLAGGDAYRVRLSIDHGTIRLNGRAGADWADLLSSLKQQAQSFRSPHLQDKIGGSPQD